MLEGEEKELVVQRTEMSPRDAKDDAGILNKLLSMGKAALVAINIDLGRRWGKAKVRRLELENEALRSEIARNAELGRAEAERKLAEAAEARARAEKTKSETKAIDKSNISGEESETVRRALADFTKALEDIQKHGGSVSFTTPDDERGVPAQEEQQEHEYVAEIMNLDKQTNALDQFTLGELVEFDKNLENMSPRQKVIYDKFLAELVGDSEPMSNIVKDMLAQFRERLNEALSRDDEEANS